MKHKIWDRNLLLQKKSRNRNKPRAKQGNQESQKITNYTDFVCN